MTSSNSLESEGRSNNNFLITSEEQQLGMQMKNIEQGESDSDFDEDAFFDALGKWKIFLFLADSGCTFLFIS